MKQCHNASNDCNSPVTVSVDACVEAAVSDKCNRTICCRQPAAAVFQVCTATRRRSRRLFSHNCSCSMSHFLRKRRNAAEQNDKIGITEALSDNYQPINQPPQMSWRLSCRIQVFILREGLESECEIYCTHFPTLYEELWKKQYPETSFSGFFSAGVCGH